MPRLVVPEVQKAQTQSDALRADDNVTDTEFELDSASLEVCSILSCKATKAQPICVRPVPSNNPPLLKLSPNDDHKAVVGSPFESDPVLSCVSPPARVNNPVIRDSRFTPLARAVMSAFERELSEDPLNDSADDDDEDEDEDDYDTHDPLESEFHQYLPSRSQAMAILPCQSRMPRYHTPAWPRLSVTC